MWTLGAAREPRTPVKQFIERFAAPLVNGHLDRAPSVLPGAALRKEFIVLDRLRHH